MAKKAPHPPHTHNRRNRLNHRTNPLRPCKPPNDRGVAQSKRFSGRNESPDGVMIYCNRLSESGTGTDETPAISRKSTDTHSERFDSPRRPAPHFRRVPVAISSPLGAEVGRIKNQAA